MALHPSSRAVRISTRMLWLDPEVRALGMPPPCQQTLFHYLLTGLHITDAPGLVRGTAEEIGAVLEWRPTAVEGLLRQLAQRDMVLNDFTCGLTFVLEPTRWLKLFVRTAQVARWRRVILRSPDCALIRHVDAEYRALAAAAGGDVLRAYETVTLRYHPRNWDRRAYGAVYARDGRACRYCGAAADLTIDHVVPRIQGGGDDLGNLVVACRACNYRKSRRTPEQAGMTLRPAPQGVR